MDSRLIAQRTVDSLKLRGRAGLEGNEKELKARILSIYDHLRLFGEAEYRVEKRRLAAGLEGLVRPKNIDGNLQRKIERFLLCPEIVPIHEEKLSRYPQV